MFSTSSSSISRSPLFTFTSTPDPLPFDVTAHPITEVTRRRSSFQLCIARARESVQAPATASALSRARQMSQIGQAACLHYRWLENRDELPDDGAFPTAEDFFADAFAKHVGNSAWEARYFTAGWLHDGLDAHDLRDLVSHFDVLTLPAARLASEALARAWNVAGDRRGFSYVLSCLAMGGLPESRLQAALEGVSSALAGVQDATQHREDLEALVSRFVMKTPEGKAAQAAAAQTLFPPGCTQPALEEWVGEWRDEGDDETATRACAGKRKREVSRESKHSGSESEDSWMCDSPSESTSETTSDASSDSSTPRLPPDPQAIEAELLAYIQSLMQPASSMPSTPTPAAAGDDEFGSPARKKGFTPRGRSPTA